MTDTPVVLDQDGHIATLTLNRPEVKNAIDPEMIETFLEQLDAVTDSDARVLVLQGAGDAFSTGGDVKQLAQAHAENYSTTEYADLIRSTFNELINALVTFRLPTVAKIDGIAFGGGANLAIACDVQLASEDAELSFGFQHIGLAVDTGTSFLLPRIVGLNTAFDLVYTGREVPAERAEELGLVTHAYPADEFEAEASNYIQQIADGPPLALQQSKGLLRDGLDSTLDQALDAEANAQAAMLQSDDHQRAIEALLVDEAPAFEGT